SFLIKNKLNTFTPVDISKILKVTNKTIINRCSKLVANGFLVPNLVKSRIRSYQLSDFAKSNAKKLI
ncbi:MAG: Fic family protein, partial [Candidatus Riflebacteria bacterium]|nr:Fic family protein [Candidatus Riflebacteria bacterium]